MPIRIVDLPEPFTPAARAAPESPPFIESDAYRQLVHELHRYCRGEVAGRSFLIAGHRGAGKTTLVQSAFEALARSTPDGQNRQQERRPLPVLLQGPTLLPNSPNDLPRAVDGSGGDKGRQLTEMENVLVQITLGLHRAVAREVVLAFRTHVQRVSGRRGVSRSELLELAAELQMELDDYTGKGRLRDIWRRADALQSGVLYAAAFQLVTESSPGTMPPGAISDRPIQEFTVSYPEDQGFRELIGLASVCDAYQRISGQLTRKDQVNSGVKTKDERSLEIDAKGKDLSAPLIAVLAGAAVGTGAAVTGVDKSTAALAGIITALMGMVAGKITKTRSRERSMSLEDMFIPDLSVATMDRVLPVLLDRLRDAGMAPVFVIDELDKVDRLSDRIPEMIRRLKKLVAENACFCFLADRNYFEEMRQRTARVPYSIEHTYFTHQLFIAFRHNDVRVYLNKVLERPIVTNPKDLEEVKRIGEEQDDHAVLPYILMHAAQMHPIDLLRQLAQLRNGEGNVALERGAVRSRRRYKLELLLQLAIEFRLEQEAMQEEMDRRPAFRRLAHDALYYISREWEKDEDILQLDDDSKQKFQDYLIARMVLEQAPVQPPSAAAADGKAAADAAQPVNPNPPAPATPLLDVPLVSVEDVNFLWRSVQTLAQELASPKDIQTQYEKRGLTGSVLDAVRGAVDLGPVIEAVPGSKAGVYRWRFRRSGREVPVPKPLAQAMPAAPVPGRAEKVVAPLRTKAIPPSPKPSAWREQAVAIRAFERTLKEVTKGAIDPSTLSAVLGILPTSPAWTSVSTALSRLETLSSTKTDYPEMEEDESVVKAFHGLLSGNIRSVTLALRYGVVLNAWNPASTPPFDAMEKMCTVLGMRDMRPEQALDQLERIGTELEKEFPSFQKPPVVQGSLLDSIAAMESAGTFSVDGKRADEVLSSAIDIGWDYWYGRLRGKTVTASLRTIICAVARAGPFEWLKLPVEMMTVRDWSVVFYESLVQVRKTSGRRPPVWLPLAALRRLGWGAGARVFMGASLFDQLKEPERTEGWGGEVGTPTFQVFIATRTSGISDTFRIVPRVAALILRTAEWQGLGNDWQKDASQLPQSSVEWTVLDASGSSAPTKSNRPRSVKVERHWVGKEFGAFLDQFASHLGPRPIPVIMDEGSREELPPPFVPIVRPKSFEDLLLRLRLEGNRETSNQSAF